MLQELAELSMAHARAITLELMAHAERVQIGDLTPMSRAMVMQSNAGFVRAARCVRLTLALKAEACDPNPKRSSPACGGGPPKAVEGAASSGPPHPTDSERLQETDRREHDIRERDVEREHFPRTDNFPADVHRELKQIRQASYRRQFPNSKDSTFGEKSYAVARLRARQPSLDTEDNRTDWGFPETPSPPWDTPPALRSLKGAGGKPRGPP